MFNNLYADRVGPMQDGSLKEVLETSPGVISFAGGLPDEEAFEYDLLQDISARVAGQKEAWQYLPTAGSPELRAEIARYMRTCGVDAQPENVLITQGSQQGLDLINKLLVNPGDQVLVEAPGYIGGLKAVENYQGDLIPIPLEFDGLSIEAAAAHCERIEQIKFLYTVSTFQNPAGCTLPPAKRRSLLELSRAHGFFIVEDGAYHELRYEGERIPPIKSLDTDGHVIYLGSFSKILVPGIRVGWIVARADIIDKITLLKQATDLAGGSFGQIFALTWLRRLGLRPPLDLYRRKRDTAHEALRRAMPQGVSWQKVHGGFFFWVTLPPAIDARRLLPEAKRNGVSFVPGYAFGGEANALRFSFSQVPLADIESGVARLARTVRNAL